VDRSERGAADRVRRAGADGAGAGERPEAIAHARVRRGDVHHRVLVAREVVRDEVAVLEERLPDAGDVAVAEDAPHALEEQRLLAVALDVLRGQEPDERLGHRETRRAAHRAAFARSASTWAGVGIASAHASCDATIAPAAFANASTRGRSQPASIPCATAPPKASPAPRPHATSTLMAGTS